MTAVKFLRQVLEAEARIDSLTAELEKWKDRADSLGGSSLGDRIQTGARSDAPFVEAVLAIADIRLKISAEIRALNGKRDEVVKVIESVSNPNRRAVLRYHYVNGFRFSMIADRMGYSERRIYQLHREALKEISLNFSKKV